MRSILHCDCNNFYASVEKVDDLSLAGQPVAVCGDPKLRHGIVLAKSDAAKACGIKTGDAVWEAKLKCPTLKLIPADQRKYLYFSKKMRAICRQYTQLVEPFGLDESWLDVTGHALGGEEIAARIRKSAKEDLGITVSVGVSFNKVFAKLASEMRKPDATTVISAENYQEKAWPLPAEDLLYVGRATTRRLHEMGLYLIGDIARSTLALMRRSLGKNGETLWHYARGEDTAPVLFVDEAEDVKSIGNSTTPPHDVSCDEEAKAIIYLLSDSVAARMRKHAFSCRTVSVWMRDTELNSFERQRRLPLSTDIGEEIAATALSLLRESYPWHLPLRSLGVRAGDLLDQEGNVQKSFMKDPWREKNRSLELSLDFIRNRWGHNCVQRGLLLCDRSFAAINPVDDHELQPLSAMRGRE